MSLPDTSEISSTEIPVYALQSSAGRRWLDPRGKVKITSGRWSIEQGIDVFRTWIRQPADETLIALWLDDQDQAVGTHYVGDLLHTGYCPSANKVFAPPVTATRQGLVAVHELVLIENHPNGAVEPDPHDLLLWPRVLRWSVSQPVRLRDYLICGNGHGRVFSFVREGLMPSARALGFLAVIVMFILSVNPRFPRVSIPSQAPPPAGAIFQEVEDCDLLM